MIDSVFVNPRVVIVLSVAAVAAICDVRTRRIPNMLTFGAAAAALAAGAAQGGASGALQALAGWALGAALFFPIFALGGMGAGDVKLLAALAAWLGPGDAIPLALFSSMAGGACALGVAVAHGYLRRALKNVWLMLMHWRVAGLGPVPGLTLQDGRAPRVAYAIPIAVGVMCTVWRH